MAKGYLIDTNILIAFQSGTLSPASQLQVASIIDEQFNISIVNKIEILGYKSVAKATEDFINMANIFDLDSKVADTTITLRKVYTIKLPDAIIAATAIVNGFTLLTRNTKDFKQIKGLLIANV